MKLFRLICHFNYIKLRLFEPCLRMVINVQCSTVKHTTNLTIYYIILIWFKSRNKSNWVVGVITWSRIGFLPGVTNCEDVELCISCKLSLSSLTGSASIVCLFFQKFRIILCIIITLEKNAVFVKVCTIFLVFDFP